MKQKTYCEGCRKLIKSSFSETLELSNTDGKYYKEIPANHVSQGCFRFHPFCAIKELRKTNNIGKQVMYCKRRHKALNALADDLEADIKAVNEPVVIHLESHQDDILLKAVQVLRYKAQEYLDKSVLIICALSGFMFFIACNPPVVKAVTENGDTIYLENPDRFAPGEAVTIKTTNWGLSRWRIQPSRSKSEVRGVRSGLDSLTIYYQQAIILK